MNFVQKGKKRLNTTQLTPEGSKKLNTRDTITHWERNITMVKDLQDEIIYSEFPLIISPSFAHLGNIQSKGMPEKNGLRGKKLQNPSQKNLVNIRN